MAATQPVATTPRVLGRDLGKLLRRFVIAVLFGVLLVVGGLAAFAESYSGKVLPGVVVGGVAVGGLSETAARDAIVGALGALEDGQIQLISSRTTGVISYAEVKRAIDTEGMLADAFGYGRGATRFEAAIAGIQGSFRPVTLPVRMGYDRPSLAAKLAAFEVVGHRPAIDATVHVRKGVFTAMPSRDGVEVDTSRVQSLIDTALRDPATPPVIRYEADSLVLPPVTSDTDVASAISLAKRLGADISLRAGSRKWTIEPRRWIRFEGRGADFAPVVDTSKAKKIFKNIKKHVTIKPTNAQFLRDRGGRVFGVSASSAGRALDVEATIDAIQAVLDGRAAGVKTSSKVEVATKAVGPELTTSEATKKAPLVERIGSWTTYYQVSARNGFAANITVPARRLNGMVIGPGQTFEFWSALGEVSFRTGYRLGAAIVGGRTVEGRALAGGICSVSTTLFNAALRGGLDIVTRRPHWYYITRYPLGLDATVSDTQTMRFRNDTRHPIMIKSMASPGVVRFELWSVPNGRTVTLSRPSVANVVRGYDTVQYTSSLAPGDRKRIEYPVDGKDVAVSRTVRDSAGRVIHHDTFTSNYHRMVGITLVGR